jgi:hypothetical protein
MSYDISEIYNFTVLRNFVESVASFTRDNR